VNRTDHDDSDGTAVGWALHALEPAEEQAFVVHMATCERCQRLVHDSQEVLGDLAYSVLLVDPPLQLLRRIRHAIGASGASAGGPPETEPTAARAAPLLRGAPARRPRWAMSAIAAALVLIALLGWNVVLQSRIGETQRIAAQRQDVITELARSSTRAVLTDSSNRTVGYVVQRGADVEIVTGGLPPNDRSRSTYVLWAVQGSGEPPRAVGTFDIIRATMDVRAVGGKPPAADTFSGFAVSKEPGRTVPQRPSQVVATGAVAG